jgi:selenocysteine-specific elongation factor
MITIGGGEILDAMPQKHRRKDKTVVEKLGIFKEGSLENRAMVTIDDAGLETIDLSRLAACRGIAPDRARGLLAALAKAGRVRTLSESPYVGVSASAFTQAVEAARVAVKRFHEANPLVQGIGREELKARLFADASTLLFQAVLHQLEADKKITVAQDVIHEFGRKVTLKADEERMRSQLAERFRSLGLQTTPAEEIIDALKLDRTTARKIIQLMLKDSQLVKVTEEMLVDRVAIEKLISQVKALKSSNPKFGVGEFKNLTGMTRKHAIPLLEYLDRQRVTRRVGDERVIL